MMTHLTRRLLHPYPDLPLTLVEAGEGRPVFVLHGGGGPASMTALGDHFMATCRVLTPTHPGWDETVRPEWFSGVDNLVEAYLDLLDDLELRDVLILGSSFGGWVATEMTVRDRGRRISQLVLMGGFGPQIPGHQLQMPGRAPGPDGPGNRTGGGPEQASPPRMGPPRIAMEALLAYTGQSLSDPKLRHRVRRIRVPTLLVWGENDTVVTPAFGRAYAASFPNARFELIPGAGHIPTREAPDATFAAIDTFMAASRR